MADTVIVLLLGGIIFLLWGLSSLYTNEVHWGKVFRYWGPDMVMKGRIPARIHGFSLIAAGILGIVAGVLRMFGADSEFVEDVDCRLHFAALGRHYWIVRGGGLGIWRRGAGSSRAGASDAAAARRPVRALVDADESRHDRVSHRIHVHRRRHLRLGIARIAQRARQGHFLQDAQLDVHDDLRHRCDALRHSHDHCRTSCDIAANRRAS